MAYLTRPNLAGTILADFELAQQIGRGYYGDVYEAIYRPNGKRFALKLLDADATEDMRRRFRSEFKVLSTLETPRLVRAHQFGELADGRLYFSSDLLPGHNFAAYLDEHRSTSPEQALLWVRQICDAVQSLHDSGILHRDLKPANMQLDDQGELTLFDLGSCKCMPLYYAQSERRYITAPEDRHITGPKKRRNLCTAGYLAPEATREDPSPSIDIYSIGAILHRILLGYTPERPCAAQARESIQLDELREVLESAIAEDPAERYQSVTTLIRDLDFALEMVRLELDPDSEDAARNPETTDEVDKPPPKRGAPKLLWMRQVAAAGLIFMLGWFAAPRSDARNISLDEPERNIAHRVTEPDAQPVPASVVQTDASNIHREPGPVESRPPKSEPPAVTPKIASPELASAGTVQPPTSRRTARTRESKRQPAKGKKTFEHDLRARMDGCQLPAQTVSYALQDGAVERLRFEQQPGRLQRSCVTDGLQARYGAHDFSGTLTYRGSGS